MNSGEPMCFLRECPDKSMDGNGSGEKAVAAIHWGARGTSVGHRSGQGMQLNWNNGGKC